MVNEGSQAKVPSKLVSYVRAPVLLFCSISEMSK